MVSSLHVHMDAHDCLEVLVLRDRAKDIVPMGESLISPAARDAARSSPATTEQNLG